MELKQTLSPELESLARWIAEDGEAEDAFYSEYAMPTPGFLHHCNQPRYEPNYGHQGHMRQLAQDPIRTKQPAMLINFPIRQSSIPEMMSQPQFQWEDERVEEPKRESPPSPNINPTQDLPPKLEGVVDEQPYEVPQEIAPLYEDIKQLSNAWDYDIIQVAETPKKRNKIMRAVNICVSVLIVCLLVAALLVFALLRLFGMELRTVMSTSMHPYHSMGSAVVVRPQPFENIQVGDDITFVARDNMVITRRVVGINSYERVLTTQGVASDALDPPVRYENVIGAVWFGVPLLGYALHWLEPTTNKIIAVIAIATVWLVLFFLEKALVKSKDDTEEEGDPKDLELV